MCITEEEKLKGVAKLNGIEFGVSLQNQVDFSLISWYNIVYTQTGGMDMSKELIYLETYVLQQDMRIRMPKTILANMMVEKGITKFAIYLDKESNELVLRVVDTKEDNA